MILKIILSFSESINNCLNPIESVSRVTRHILENYGDGLRISIKILTSFSKSAGTE
jgi:hypothetical protein